MFEAMLPQLPVHISQLSAAMSCASCILAFCFSCKAAAAVLLMQQGGLDVVLCCPV